MTRRCLVAVVLGAPLLALPRPAAAHGIGGRSDLPVPLGFFLVGAAVVLVLSFAALAVLWPRPRLQQPPVLRPLPLPGIRSARAVLRVLGVTALALVVATGIVGLDNSARNPASVLVWVGFWLVVPFAAALFGDLYHTLNPWRSLAAWLGLGEREQPERVKRWGVWPATAVFIAFIWLELIYPDAASPRTVAIAALAYTGLLMAAMEWTGRETALTTVDAFTPYNRLIAGIAPVTTTDDGRPAWRGWLRGLPHLPEWPGLWLFVSATIGTVSFDGLSGTPWHADTFGAFGQSLPGATVGLVVSVAVIAAAYLTACWAAARAGGRGEWTAPGVASRFAHTLVPIGLAYAVAHYLTLIIFEGQLLISTMSDPLGLGWDLFGTAGRPVDYTLLSPAAVWYLQVATIVGGHLAGVILAHDRALHDFPPVTAVRSQYAMLALMVILTGLGLTILAAG